MEALYVAGAFLVEFGPAIASVASVAATAYSMSQSPEGTAIPDTQVQIGDTASPIDKTAMQQDAELGKLELGEDEMGKKKRKKGKAAFKIALAEEDKKKKEDTGSPQTGVQVAKPEALGAQL